MKSNRYRFWRMVAYTVLGVLAGFSMGYMGAHFDSVGHLQLMIDWSVIQLLLSILGVLSFAGEVYYLVQTRKASQLLATLSEDEEIEQADKAANRAYNIASILAGALAVFVYASLGVLWTLLFKEKGDVWIPVQSALLTVLMLISSRLIHLSFKDVHGQEIPKNINLKEWKKFSLSLMDEAERQIQSEESFGLLMRLVGYIFPGIYIFLYAMKLLLGTDIMLTIFIVSALYIYILISQYRIVKRYYK